MATVDLSVLPIDPRPVAPSGRVGALRLGRPGAMAWTATTLLAGSYVVLGAVLIGTGLAVDWSGLGVLLGFSAAALVLGLAMTLTTGLGRFADVTLVVATLLGSTLANILSLNAGLRLRLPLRDAELRAADAVLGLDAAQLVASFAEYPRLTAWLNMVYVNSNWLAAAAVLLATVRRRDRAAQALWCYSGGLLVVTILSTLLPALGSSAFMRLADLPGLPAGAGTYHLDVFRYYRDDAGAVLGNAHLSGVAVFPSFHTIMGLVIATGLYGTRAAPLGLVVGALTIVSAVPIGGHYLVDIVAAVAVWVALMGWGERVAR